MQVFLEKSTILGCIINQYNGRAFRKVSVVLSHRNIFSLTTEFSVSLFMLSRVFLQAVVSICETGN